MFAAAATAAAFPPSTLRCLYRHHPRIAATATITTTTTPVAL